MEDCANTQALNKYLDEQDRADIALENFLNAISDELSEIDEISNRIRSIANDYEGYDFTDDAIEAMKEIL